jgi:hypothetical protein
MRPKISATVTVLCLSVPAAALAATGATASIANVSRSSATSAGATDVARTMAPAGRDAARDIARSTAHAARDAARDAARTARRSARRSARHLPAPTPTSTPTGTTTPPTPTSPTSPPATPPTSPPPTTGGSPVTVRPPWVVTRVAGTFAAYFAPDFAGIASKTFSVQKVTLLADVTSPAFLRVSYPAGSSAPSSGLVAGGAQLELPIAAGAADDATLTYKVRFPVGFQWIKGGKLPGLCGGTCNSGGVDPNGTNGWSERLMWRTAGAAEVYSYSATTVGYGDSLGRGDWYWRADGLWHTVSEHVHLNTPGVADGYVDITYDGKVVAHDTGIVFRTVPTLHINALLFSTFYGGHDITWAPTADMYADFADFRIVRG